MDYTTELYYQKLQSEINRLNFRLCCLIDTFCTRVEDCGGGGSGWLLTGNAGTTAGTNFLGTTDDAALIFKVFGDFSGVIETGNGSSNTSFGYLALPNYLSVSANTAIGFEALTSLTTAIAPGDSVNNVAVGSTSQELNLTGSNNVSVGSSSLHNNTAGDNNVSIGSSSGQTVDSNSNTLIGASTDVTVAGTTNAIALGYQAVAATNEFAISPNVQSINFSSQGILHRSQSVNYGTTIFPGSSSYHIYYTGSTGATGVDLTGILVNQILVVSDFDRISSTSNITIDAGVGNTISSLVGAAQTYLMNQDGMSVTLQRLSTTQFMII